MWSFSPKWPRLCLPSGQFLLALQPPGHMVGGLLCTFLISAGRLSRKIIFPHLKCTKSSIFCRKKKISVVVFFISLNPGLTKVSFSRINNEKMKLQWVLILSSENCVFNLPFTIYLKETSTSYHHPEGKIEEKRRRIYFYNHSEPNPEEYHNLPTSHSMYL